MTRKAEIVNDPYGYHYERKCFRALLSYARTLPKLTLGALHEALNELVAAVEREYFDCLFELKSRGLVVCNEHGEEDHVATQIRYPRLRKLLKKRRAVRALRAVCVANSRGDYGTD
ncbi:hypothetical protein GCM10007901_41010 [Dyella acidisoli]|uniref:Uncharacterized protein n=1 Tax=Dyella acidisoli TaxID=1867834 RepID=A0ABQ5XUI6_9GAMM|nr:hypothetical protein GCM10007901_41010 [Dyella acidisoli]